MGGTEEGKYTSYVERGPEQERAFPRQLGAPGGGLRHAPSHANRRPCHAGRETTRRPQDAGNVGSIAL